MDPLKLFVYRYYSPRHRQWVTLDCPAVSRAAALASAQRFVNRQNRRLRRANVPTRVPYPSHENFLKLEGADHA